MKEYYVEVYFPPFPNKGRKVRVFRKFVRDALSPDLIVLYKVNAIDRDDALAIVLMGNVKPMLGKVA
jgi:hypothetical protein